MKSINQAYEVLSNPAKKHQYDIELNIKLNQSDRIDSLTRMLNKLGIIEKVQSEIRRFNRYGNIFSLIMFAIEDIKINKSIEQELKEHVVKFVGQVLSDNIRKLDELGRWEENEFLLLLPETDLASGLKVAEKISNILGIRKIMFNNKAYKVTTSFTTIEYESSLEDALKRSRKGYSPNIR
jgi:diguanylate cyclase (GGDEF)-like protein